MYLSLSFYISCTHVITGNLFTFFFFFFFWGGGGGLLIPLAESLNYSKFTKTVESFSAPGIKVIKTMMIINVFKLQAIDMCFLHANKEQPRLGWILAKDFGMKGEAKIEMKLDELRKKKIPFFLYRARPGLMTDVLFCLWGADDAR